ncbi:nucleotidyltransferase family protein [Cohnella faecalis]|nr:nucleotidyltransferase family protein [Cohnella faecalis]
MRQKKYTAEERLLFNCLAAFIQRNKVTMTDGEPDWPSFLALANKHRLFPILYNVLKQEPSIPEFVLDILKKDVEFNQRVMLEMTATIAGLLKELEDRGIDALILKGIPLAIDLYGDVSLRTSRDVDLFVAPEHYEQVEALLIQKGFANHAGFSDINPSMKRYIIENKDSHYHTEFHHHSRPLTIEIHWRQQSATYGKTAFAKLWQRRAYCRLGSYAFPTLGAEDQLDYLLLHGAKHMYARLRWLLDIVLHLKKYPSLVQEKAKHPQLQDLLAQAKLICSELWGQALPPSIRVTDRSKSLAKQAIHFVVMDDEVKDILFGTPDYFRYKKYLWDVKWTWRDRLQYVGEHFQPTISDLALVPCRELGIRYIFWRVRLRLSKSDGSSLEVRMEAYISFIRSFCQFSGWKLASFVVLSVIFGFIEGIGILTLIPILSVAGMSAESTGGPFASLFSWLNEQALSGEQLLTIGLLLYLLLTVFQVLVQRQVALTNVQLVQGFAHRLRTSLFSRLLKAPWADVSRYGITVQHIISQELPRIAQGVNAILQLLIAMTVTVLQLGIAFCISVKFTLMIVVCAALLMFFGRNYFRSATDLGTSMSGLMRKSFAMMLDYVSGIKDMKAYQLEGKAGIEFASTSRLIFSRFSEHAALTTRTTTILKLGVSIFICAVVYISVALLKVPFSHLLVLLVIVARLWPRFSSANMQLQQAALLMSSFSQYKSVSERLREEYDAITSESDWKVKRLHRHIALNNVSFAYKDGRAALSGVSLQIPAKELTIIIGASGSGKSTLLDLMMGFQQPTEGTIMIDGEALNSSWLACWRQSVSYVGQQLHLFNGTVRDNLLAVKDRATEEEIGEALRLSGSESIVAKLPNGLDTLLGEGGEALSTGERQRLVLARALLKEPTLLLLDEVTSALDIKNEADIMRTFSALREKTTIVMVAHRPTVLPYADRIILLREGAVVKQWSKQEGISVEQILLEMAQAEGG